MILRGINCFVLQPNFYYINLLYVYSLLRWKTALTYDFDPATDIYICNDHFDKSQFDSLGRLLPQSHPTFIIPLAGMCIKHYTYKIIDSSIRSSHA